MTRRLAILIAATAVTASAPALAAGPYAAAKHPIVLAHGLLGSA